MSQYYARELSLFKKPLELRPGVVQNDLPVAKTMDGGEVGKGRKRGGKKKKKSQHSDERRR